MLARALGTDGLGETCQMRCLARGVHDALGDKGVRSGPRCAVREGHGIEVFASDS